MQNLQTKNVSVFWVACILPHKSAVLWGNVAAVTSYSAKSCVRLEMWTEMSEDERGCCTAVDPGIFQGDTWLHVNSTMSLHFSSPQIHSSLTVHMFAKASTRYQNVLFFCLKLSAVVWQLLLWWYTSLGLKSDTSKVKNKYIKKEVGLKDATNRMW